MDLWQLKIFCKVIELKSFSKAGETVHLSQPTVSSHIKDLETHLGTRLVDRLARTALPTKAGELLYDYARRLLALRDETESAMAEFLGKIRGRLALGGSTIPGAYLLPRFIGQFRARYPKVRIALTVGDTREMISKLMSGQIEMAVVGARSDDHQLVQKRLIEDRMCVVVPSDHPWARRKQISLTDLKAEPFIIREPGSGTLKSLEQRLRKHHCSINDFHVTAEMGSTEAVRQGIKNKVGVSILSAIAVADDERSGALKTLAVKDLDLTRSFYLTTCKHRSPSPLCRAFVEFLQQHL
jgi:DNA-binding transcriptional LysR family regulator